MEALMEFDRELFSEPIATGNLAEVQKLIGLFKSEIDDELYDSLFTISLKSGYKLMAEYLLSLEEFNLNFKTEDHHSYLILLINLGYLDLASKSIERGINVNSRNQDNQSALLLALENEYFDLANSILSSSGEINIRGDKGWTPLIWASIKGYKKSVQFLIENNADVHIKNDDGWDAITGAFYKNQLSVVKILSEQGAMFGGKYAEAALLSAYVDGHYDVVEEILAQNVNVNVYNKDNESLLMLAIQRSDFKFATLFLNHGAQFDIRSKEGNTPLSVAIDLGLTEIAVQLINAGAAVNLTFDYKASYLHLASEQGLETVCSLLIDKNAPIDALDCYGRTALGRAVKSGYLNIVKLLIENNATVSKEREIASKEGQKQIEAYLKSSRFGGVYAESALVEAYISGDYTEANRLIEEGTSVNVLYQKDSLLIMAIKRGDKPFVETLLKNNADINTRDADGILALSLAIFLSHIDIALLLLEKGAVVSLTDKTKELMTPLHYAARAGNVSLCEELIKRNISIESKSGSYNRTPLDLAASHGYLGVVKLLVECGATSSNGFKLAAEKEHYSICAYLTESCEK